MQEPKAILRIEEMPISEWHIPKLIMCNGEWCHLSGLDEDFINELLEMLLLKKESSSPFKYFNEVSSELNLRSKSLIRKKISFWPPSHEEIINDDFIMLKRKLIDTRNNEKDFATRLFLDHLMLGDVLDSKLKRLFVSLFMNSPQLLIIDRALDLFEGDELDKILVVITRYSQKTGMAILNITSSEDIINRMKARHFIQKEKNLLELMTD